jgi:Rho-binding antiterminator
MPVSCENYDYLEIACMYGYEVVLLLLDGRQYQGIACNLLINSARQEVVEVKLKDSVEFIHLDSLKELRVETDGAKFKQVLFL